MNETFPFTDAASFVVEDLSLSYAYTQQDGQLQYIQNASMVGGVLSYTGISQLTINGTGPSQYCTSLSFLSRHHLGILCYQNPAKAGSNYDSQIFTLLDTQSGNQILNQSSPYPYSNQVNVSISAGYHSKAQNTHNFLSLVPCSQLQNCSTQVIQLYSYNENTSQVTLTNLRPIDFGINTWQLEGLVVIEEYVYLLNNIPAGPMSVQSTKIIRFRVKDSQLNLAFNIYPINPTYGFGLSGLSNLGEIVLSVAHDSALREYRFNNASQTFDQTSVNENTGTFLSHVRALTSIDYTLLFNTSNGQTYIYQRFTNRPAVWSDFYYSITTLSFNNLFFGISANSERTPYTTERVIQVYIVEKPQIILEVGDPNVF